MEIIGQEGAGIIVIINRPVADRFTSAVREKSGEVSVAEMEALRDYGVGASILTELGVREMILLTNTHHTMIGLDGYGLTVIEERRVD
jgi:3,4-dihydroxy 2-butanone 4-phosphate synthase/GTP cyclohydrolase II